MTIRVSGFASPRKIKTQVSRDKAQRKVQKAVARGTMKKPDRCQRCRKLVEKKKLHGHHTNYGKKPAIKWLCALCHSKAHGPERHARDLMFQALRESGLIGH